MNIIFEKGRIEDIEKLAELYDNLNDYLATNTNYPGWIKGIYPIRQHAVEGVEEGTLYTAKISETIVGSVILSHKPEKAYSNAKWKFESDYSDILVIHTFVIHPQYMNMGIGKSILNFCDQIGKEKNIKSIRLDVYENNLPAIKLYEKCGYDYIDTVDLGLGNYGLNWFKLYEKLLNQL